VKTLQKGEPAEALALRLPVLMGGSQPMWECPPCEQLSKASDDEAVAILKKKRSLVLLMCPNCRLVVDDFKLTVCDLALKLNCDC